MRSAGYPYSNLTSAIADKKSPLRCHLDFTFPALRLLQNEYRTSVGPLLVEGGDANAGTLGAAFDFLVRFTLAPAHTPQVALHAVTQLPAVASVIEEVRRTAEHGAADARSSEAPEALLRACWVFALTTEVYRVGLIPGTPLAKYITNRDFTERALLGLAPDSAIRQLQSLQTVSRERLYPAIAVNDSLALGPTFDGSRMCAADADLIAGGALLDIKTRLGAKTQSGRRDSLSLTDVYQLLGYALFDRSDAYGIREVGIYSARFGFLVRWPLADFLDTLAGRRVDLRVEREAVWALLGGAGPDEGR